MENKSTTRLGRLDRNSFKQPRLEKNDVPKVAYPKQFNLEDALRGKPVILRNGTKVNKVIHLSSMKSERNVLVVFEDDCMLYRENGTATYVFKEGEEHYSDLVMDKLSIWVNVFERNGTLFTEGNYPSEENALMHSKDRINRDFHIKTIEITNEL
jgi:hypothetical protein